MSTLWLFMSWRRCAIRSVVSTCSISSGLKRGAVVAKVLVDVQAVGEKKRVRFLSIGDERVQIELAESDGTRQQVRCR
jgi:hypothetical protein